MRRRSLIVLVGLPALAVVLYSGLWFLASGNLRDGVERWAAERRADGWRVDWDDFSIGGFPLVLRARVTAPRIAAPNATWGWRGPDIIATTLPWDFNRPTFVFPGRHQISIPHEGSARIFSLTAAEAVGNVQIRTGVPVEITAKLSQIDFRSANGEQTIADAMSLRFAPQISDPPGPFASLALAGVVLPAGPHAVLGRNISALDAELKLLGVSAFKPSTRLGLPAALGDWRDQGGTIEIKRLHLDWGGMKFDGDGTVALDAELQPIGAMQARIQGFRALVDGLVRARLVSARDADMAKFVLSMVARATPGGNNTVTVPVTIQDRRLFIGPAKLMELPRIDWKN
jgi:hypothetical protein